MTRLSIRRSLMQQLAREALSFSAIGVPDSRRVRQSHKMDYGTNARFQKCCVLLQSRMINALRETVETAV